MWQYSQSPLIVAPSGVLWLSSWQRKQPVEVTWPTLSGYVPNVTYSCGSILHMTNLVIAYGASDTSTRFATLSLDSLLGALSSG